MRKINVKVKPIGENDIMNLGLFEFIPHEGVGKIKFYQPLSDNMKREYLLTHKPDEELPCVGWEVWETAEGSFRVSLEDALVTSIGCYSICLFREKNIIGLTFEEVSELLDSYPDKDSIEVFDLTQGEETAVDYDDYDAQIWFKDNKASAAIVG